MYETEVARGMALLDERMPGWEHNIDLGSLDVGSPSRCVVGQLFEGGFTHGITELDLTDEDGYNDVQREIEHGFEVPMVMTANGYEEREYGPLTEEWTHQIAGRLLTS